MQSGGEHDPGFWAQALDYAWALILVTLVPLIGWAMGHERRLTTLEAQHLECARDRVRDHDDLKDLRGQLSEINSKLDHLIGALGKPLK